MALTSKSLILYGLRITPLNRSLDFKTALIGVERQATLRLGFYSLSQLLTEIVRAMQEADPANEYTATADRTYSGGTQNRVTIGTTTGTFLSLLFGTGSRTASSVAPVIGFPTVDQTGSLNYLGVSSCGTVLIPDYTAYTYLGPEFMRTVFGSVNIAADGSKEAIVFQVQRFLQCEFKYEQKAKVILEWTPFLNWGIQQRPFEFTPEIIAPTLFYPVTFESTPGDAKALAYVMKEMLPNFPNHYQTGIIKMRQIVPPGGFL